MDLLFQMHIVVLLKGLKFAVRFCILTLQSLTKQHIKCSAKAHHKAKEYKKYLLSMLQLVQHITLFCCSCYYFLFPASTFWLEFST